MLQNPASAAPGDVKAALEAPCKYPSGLASDGKHLFVADWRDARIFDVDPSTGKVGRTWNAPTLKPSGLAFGDGKLFVSDDHTGRVLAVDPQTGVIRWNFEAPDKEATGLAFADGALFILAKDKIYKVLPDDGTILTSFNAPDKTCSCMTHDGNYLWVSNRMKDEIYMVDPREGKVLGIIKSPGPYPAGLAWLDGHLWNIDFQTRKLYQLIINDNPMYRVYDARKARVEYLWAITNYGPSELTGLTLSFALPMALPRQKLLSEIEFSQPPTKKARDRWDQECAVFEISPVAAGSKAAASYTVKAEISAIRYLILPDKTGTLSDIPADIREKYTVDGTHLLINSSYIQKTAGKIVGDEKNPCWIARKIYDFVTDHIKYEMVGGWDVPEQVLKRGKGSCSESTYTFVALCRAAGLPARYQGSIVVRGDDASVDDAFHRWAEIYLPNYGWVPVDASRGRSPTPADQARGFGELSNRYLITTIGGGDSEYLNWGYNSFAKYEMTGFCKVEEDNFGFWEPLEPAKEPTDSAKPAAGEAGKDPAQCKKPAP
jgi:transglutaminase-like putative cysteine protease/outer membrane protein assembly factor BamB